MKGSCFFITLICLLLSTSIVHAARIGIFGCSHGDQEFLQKAIRGMKSQNITDIIGNGDFVTNSGVYSLEKELKTLTAESKLEKNHIFLMPGNWEGTQYSFKSDLLETFKKYGNLITEKYDESGIIEIDAKKIQIAHFPQHPIPKESLPPDEYLYKYHEHQPHLLSTMARGSTIPKDISLNIYGHTHIRSHFYDQHSGALTINSGCLTNRKKPQEARSFAIYDTEKGHVEFYNIETEEPKLIEIVNTSHLESKNQVNTQDVNICGLHPASVRKLIKEVESYSDPVGRLKELLPPSEAHQSGELPFKNWLETHNYEVMSHGIWSDNVDIVLNQGTLKPAELVLRETGTISYEKDKSFGKRATDAIKNDDLEKFVNDFVHVPVCKGLIFVKAV